MIKTVYKTSDGRYFDTMERADLHEASDFETWLQACGYDKFLKELDDRIKTSYHLTERALSEYVLHILYERDSDR